MERRRPAGLYAAATQCALPDRYTYGCLTCKVAFQRPRFAFQRPSLQRTVRNVGHSPTLHMLQITIRWHTQTFSGGAALKCMHMHGTE